MSADRTEIERFNNIVFGAILVALLLSFVDDNSLVLAVELACRATVVVLVAVAVVRFRRDYFSHWTSWLATAVALLSVFRLLAVFTVG